MIDLTSIYISNGLGLAALITTVFCNRTLLGTSRKDLRYVWILIMSCMIATVVDPIVFTLDGVPGTLSHWVNVLGNTYLYFANAWFAVLWIAFLMIHLKGNNTDVTKRIHMLCILPGILTLLLIINIFKPIIFEVSEANIFSRTPLAYIFWAYVGLYILHSVAMYFVYRRSSGRIRYFPIAVFIVPVVLGAVLQGVFYGISLTWPSVAIAICGLMMCIKAEVAFVDQLTGIHNRSFLFSTKFHKKMHGAIMMDINNFKSINDNYGHLEGDAALTVVAEIIAGAASGKGFAVRYGGDEFIVFCQSDDSEVWEQVCNEIQEKLDEINASGKKEYTLGVSCGYAGYDHEHETLDELLKKIDAEMYESKRRYYSGKGERRSR